MVVDKKIVSILLAILFLPNICFAGDSNLTNAFGGNSHLNTVAQKSGYDISTDSNINVFFGSVVQVILSLVGVFFLALMIYGGFLWMTDRGNSDQVERAKKLITAAIIGLLIILMSYAISYFVINALSSSTLSG